MGSDEDEVREDLAATADSIQHDARRIDRLEERKRGLEPGDPRVDDLSTEVEQLAAAVMKKAKIERQMAAAATEGDTADGGANDSGGGRRRAN